MPWSTPQTPKRFADELIGFSKALRIRARDLPILAKFDFHAEVRPFVAQLKARAKRLTRGTVGSRPKREDMRIARLAAAEALTAAAGLLEARVFEDFEGTTDRETAAELLRAAADLLDERALRDFGVKRRRKPTRERPPEAREQCRERGLRYAAARQEKRRGTES